MLCTCLESANGRPLSFEKTFTPDTKVFFMTLSELERVGNLQKKRKEVRGRKGVKGGQVMFPAGSGSSLHIRKYVSLLDKVKDADETLFACGRGKRQ